MLTQYHVNGNQLCAAFSQEIQNLAQATGTIEENLGTLKTIYDDKVIYGLRAILLKEREKAAL